jgi:hypothetical protein
LTGARDDLSRRQRGAIRSAEVHRPSAEARARALLLLSCWQRASPEPLILEQPQLTINFHPDRAARGDIPMLSALARSGRLLSQFVTGTSSGFALEEKDSLRIRSEARRFGSAYAEAEAHERPKYGAVNLFANPRGGWPRFGSSFWILSSSVRWRCTATVPGSLGSSAWWGSVDDLVALLPREALPPHGTNHHRFPLIDGPAELQIHGDVLLGRDVIGAVLDPSFRGTETERRMSELTRTHGMSLGWAPPLAGDAPSWSLGSARQRARERVRAAVTAREAITAEWIGRDTWVSTEGSAERAAADRASRWLWNRLLLSQLGPLNRRR